MAFAGAAVAFFTAGLAFAGAAGFAFAGAAGAFFAAGLADLDSALADFKAGAGDLAGGVFFAGAGEWDGFFVALDMVRTSSWGADGKGADGKGAWKGVDSGAGYFPVSLPAGSRPRL